jgi:ATP-dependent RNA helicase SUPV3L1/SUV3
MYEANIFISKMEPTYRFTEYRQLALMSDFIDENGGDLTLEDRIQLMMAPISWRDSVTLGIVSRFLRMYRTTMNVNLKKCLEDSNLINEMVEVEGMMLRGTAPTSSPNTLAMLETLHKVLGLYMWLSCRNPCSFSDHEDVADLKDRVEKVLDWCLEGVSWQARTLERPMRDKRRDSKIAWTPRKLLKGTPSRISAGDSLSDFTTQH